MMTTPSHSLPHCGGDTLPVAATRQRVGTMSWCATADAHRDVLFNVLPCGECHDSNSSHAVGTRDNGKEYPFMPTHERRAVRAISEAEDVLDDIMAVRRYLEHAWADGRMTASEIMDARVRLERLVVESRESIIAAQWTDAGERRAVGEMVDEMPERVMRYEREIIRDAQAIGFDLGRVIPFPRQQPTSAA